MAEHIIQTNPPKNGIVFQLRSDTYLNWMNSNLILKMGEAAISIFPHENINNPPEAIGIKIGDGVHYFNELPWIQAIAADVHNWAKAQNKPTYSAIEINGLEEFIQQHTSGGGGSSDPSTITARLYRLIRGTGDNINKYYLQSKEANEEQWITDELNYIDLSQLAAVVSWLSEGLEDYWNISGFTVEKVQERLRLLNYTSIVDTSTVVTAVNQTNGQISVTRGAVNTAAITGILGVEHGGTGRNSLDYDSVLVGNGTDSVLTKPIDTELTNNNNLATNRAIVNYITNATAGLAGAMHYIGEATVEITNNSSINPRISEYNFSRAQPGDVVIFNSTEYVWTGSNWHIFGDETKTALLETEIETIIELLKTKVDKEEGKQLSTNDYTTAEKEKLAGISEGAEVNVINSILLNREEIQPSNGAVNLQIPILTQEQLDNINVAQENVIEHIFVNNDEIQPTTIQSKAKSIGINFIPFTQDEKDKLQSIERNAQENIIETILINNQPQLIQDKTINIIIDQEALNLNVLAGARVPDGNNGYEDVDITPTGIKKLELARIAKTGNISDIQQTQNTYFIIDCGTSINNLHPTQI